MVVCGHEEVAGGLALQRLDVAVGCQLVVAWELVFRVFVDVELFVLLTSLNQVALDKHLDLETQVVVVRVRADSQEVETVFLVNCVLDVVELPLMLLEELVGSSVSSKSYGLLQLVDQRA